MRVFLYLFLILLLSSPALAIGLAHEHLEDRTLKLAPGENYFFKLTIQNNEDEDILLNVSMESDIAVLAGGGLIEVPAKNLNSFVYFDIQVPEDAKQGDTYNLHYVVMPAAGRGEGQVPFMVKYDRSITILVEGELLPTAAAIREEPADLGFVQQPKAGMNYWFLALIILPIAALLVLLWQRSDLIAKRLKRSVKPFRGGMQPKVASPGKQFRLANGKQIASAPELLEALRHMDEQTFKHHVTSTKNDFSRWLETALDAPSMAKNLAAKPTRKGMMRVLEDALH